MRFLGEALGRKRHGGVLRDLFEIAAMLPWWLEAGLALAAYIVFHSIATGDIATTTMPAEVGMTDLGHPWQAFAGYLQYLLPLALLAGALASAIAEERRRGSEKGAEREPAAEPDRLG